MFTPAIDLIQFRVARFACPMHRFRRPLRGPLLMPRPMISVLGVVVLLVGAPGVVEAEDDASATDTDFVDYAFAAHIGTGKYSAAGRTVYVHRIPVSFTVRAIDGRSWGLKLNLDATVGFVDFHPPRLLKSGLPDDLETISLVPGARLAFPLRRNWLLMPFAGLGLGKDLSGGSLTWIYSTGIENRVTLESRRLRFTLGNTWLHTGQSAPGTKLSDSFLSVETGGDIRPVLTCDVFRRRAGVSVYALNLLYLSDLEFLRFTGEPLRVNAQFEIGATIGMEPAETPIKVLGIALPRLGVGTRFGGGLHVLRLIVGEPF